MSLLFYWILNSNFLLVRETPPSSLNGHCGFDPQSYFIFKDTGSGPV